MSQLFLQSAGIVLLVIGALLLVMAEFGYRLGRCHSPEARKAFRPQIGTLQGALLVLLGLLLGFTFAMAIGRFENRAQLVQEEANAIGDVWLRAGLLGDQARDAIRPTLQDYVQARLAGADAEAGSEEYVRQVERSERDQSHIWRAMLAETKAGNASAAELMAAPLTLMIGLDSKRQASALNHVPNSVWLLLVITSVTVCAATGYATALGDYGRHLLSMAVLPVLLAVVIATIADIDNPWRGFLNVSQHSMVKLQNTMMKYQ